MAILKGSRPKKTVVVPSLLEGGTVSSEHSEKVATTATPTQSVIRSHGYLPKKTVVLNPLKTIVAEEVAVPGLTGTASEVAGSLDEAGAVLVSKPVNEEFRIEDGLTQSKLQQYEAEAKQAIDRKLAIYEQEKIASIEHERQEILEHAYQEGFEEGHQDMMDQLETYGNELTDHINELSAVKTKTIEAVKKELLTLAFEMAQRIVNQVLADDPDTFKGIIDQAIVRITDKDKVIIRVHPAHASLVRQYKDDILYKLPDIKNLEIQEDPKMEFGGCVIETKMGFVDATLSTKFDILRKALLHLSDEEDID